VKRRDRHGRGLRGVLAPAGLPLYRSRAERFDELVLSAVARLEPRWEAQIAGVEFAVEEIPPADAAPGHPRGPVPLARLDPGLPRPPGGAPGDDSRRDVLIRPGQAGEPAADGTARTPPRIVVYRRPLLARADAEDDLGELVFDVVVEEFARLLGLDPEDVDPGYSGTE
jgi:predicted Zn-dependent protease with MMP-like domain